MKQMQTKKLFGAIAAALMLASAGAAYAATATQNVTITGTITPPPASCTFSGGVTSINFSATAGAANIDSAPISVAFTCTTGASYSVSTSSSWTPITIGGTAAGARLNNNAGNLDLFTNPIAATGNGASQSYSVAARLGGVAANSALDPATHVGAVSGTLALVVTY